MKYAFLLLALMFAGIATPSMAQKLTFKFEGQTIEVAKKDFPNEMNWWDAMAACQNLLPFQGNGWRLPSIEELKAMYEQLHTKGKGNFQNKWYWSSLEINSENAWYFNFESGEASNYYEMYGSKYWPYHVRAVRTLP